MKQTVIFTLTVILVCSVLFAVTGCGEGTVAESASPSVKSYSDTEDGDNVVYPRVISYLPDDAYDSNYNVAIIYFSATGNTEEVAEKIGEVTGGILYAVEPFELYTEEDLDYDNPDSRVSLEYAEHTTVPIINNTIPNWDNVEYVYLGYPIWFDEAAFPMQSFVSSTSFTDKVIIPFCTSDSSELGDSSYQLAEMANTGTWLKGTRFSPDVSLEEIERVIAEYGITTGSQVDVLATGSPSASSTAEAESSPDISAEATAEIIEDEEEVSVVVNEEQ